MDDQIIKTLTLPQRWGFSLGLSLMLWVMPITFKAPTLAIFLSMLGSLYGFGRCITLSSEWREQDRFKLKMRLHNEELQNYQLALDEEATKREMVDLTFGSFGSVSSELEPEPRPNPGSESLPHLPRSHSSDLGSVSVQSPNPPNPSSRLYTAQNLTLDEALDLIGKLALTMTQTQIIEGLWKVKKGSSKAYKAAVEEFKLITT